MKITQKVKSVSSRTNTPYANANPACKTIKIVYLQFRVQKSEIRWGTLD